jgi:iron complex outermembrane receptor protein
MRWVPWGLAATASALAVFLTSPALADQPAAPLSGEDLNDLSIEQLAQIQVRSASKRDQPLSDAAAALYVIDHDQIVRSGAVTIPEILRLAPNLQVFQSSPSNWIVTARGFSGLPATQSYSNKLLVMIDGRTVYTPLFSGVYWDLPDLLPDDIERIEVISGPGANLWGANAVNGVINIITRSAASGAGAFADIDAGTVEQAAGLRLGGQAGRDLAYRVYGRWVHQGTASRPDGVSAEDGWNRLGGGFRLDWTPAPADSVTLEGDIFDGRDDQPGLAHDDTAGRSLVARWNRDPSEDEHFQAQAFYDRISRASRPNNGSFYVDTYDVDVQQSLAIGSRNDVVFGGGGRLVHYVITGTPSLFFTPDSRNLFLGDIFAQDTIALSDAVSVTAGIKAEHDPYVGVSLLPDLRIAVKSSSSTLLWAAVSHAVRSPTPFDEDVREVAPGVTLNGNPDFRTEKLTAYEVGVRAQPVASLSFSATGFYHRYDDLRTVEIGSGPGLNLHWANELAGHSYGIEAWASASPLSWWTLSAGATLLREDLHFKPGATAPGLGTSQDGLDPSHDVTLRSSMNIGRSVVFDLDFRAVGALGTGKIATGGVPAYAELAGRLAWTVSNHLELVLSGANLLHERHVEYPSGDAIPRKVMVGLQWRR